MDEERIIEIESKLAFQEYTIRKLNEVLFEQQKQIDSLTNVTHFLKDRLRDVTDSMPLTKIRDEKPPHY